MFWNLSNSLMLSRMVSNTYRHWPETLFLEGSKVLMMREDNLFWSPNFKQTKIILFTVLTAITSTLHTHSEKYYIRTWCRNPWKLGSWDTMGFSVVHISNTTVENNSFQHWACGKLQFSSVQSLTRVRLFATSWIPVHQASLSITTSRSSLKLTSIRLVIPSSHLVPCF